MVFGAALLLLQLAVTPSPDTAAPSPAGVVTEVRIHGNLLTPDDEIRRLSGVEIGAPVDSGTTKEIEARLLATRKFEQVQVVTRFASIADPTAILVVIIVDEGAVKIEMTGDPQQPTRVVRKRTPNVFVLPLLTAEDGYGLTYGARFTLAARSSIPPRISVPLTWGGQKRAAIEIEKNVEHGLFSRFKTGAAIESRTNPFVDRHDDRERVWFRAERELPRSLRIGGGAEWQHIAFLGAHDRLLSGSADIALDTRQDPVAPRNAVYARAAWTYVDPGHTQAANQLHVDVRGYVGLVDRIVLVVRALRDDADAPLPVYLKPLLGGLENLRGFKAGIKAGDKIAAGSLELRVPFSGPLSVRTFGASVFLDAAAAYDHGERMTLQRFDNGVGASAWLTVAFAQINVALARGIGSGTRVHVGGTVSF